MNTNDTAAGEPRREQRLSRRARVLLGARLHGTEGAADAWIRDLSARGALVACPAPFTAGTQLVLTRGDTAVPARVAWQAKGRMGLEFAWAIDAAQVLVPSPAPAKADMEDYRRPGFRAQTELSDEERRRIEIWGGA